MTLFSFLVLFSIASGSLKAEQVCNFQGTPEQALHFLSSDPNSDPCSLDINTPEEVEQCRRDFINNVTNHRASVYIYQDQDGKYHLSPSRPTSLGGAQTPTVQGPCPTTDEILNNQAPQTAGDVGFSPTEGPREQPPAEISPTQPMNSAPLSLNPNQIFDGNSRRGQTSPVQVAHTPEAVQLPQPQALGAPNDQETPTHPSEPTRFNLHLPTPEPDDNGLGRMLQEEFNPNQRVARLIKDISRKRGLPDATSRLRYAQDCIRSAAAVMFAAADHRFKLEINSDQGKVDIFDYASGCVNWIFDQHR